MFYASYASTPAGLLAALHEIVDRTDREVAELSAALTKDAGAKPDAYRHGELHSHLSWSGATLVHWLVASKIAENFIANLAEELRASATSHPLERDAFDALPEAQRWWRAICCEISRKLETQINPGSRSTNMMSNLYEDCEAEVVRRLWDRISTEGQMVAISALHDQRERQKAEWAEERAAKAARDEAAEKARLADKRARRAERRARRVAS